MIPKDYSRDEIAALAMLERRSLTHEWTTFQLGEGPEPILWMTDPEKAEAIDRANKRDRRVLNGLRDLYRRGVVERRWTLKGPRMHEYRLIDALQPAPAEQDPGFVGYAVMDARAIGDIDRAHIFEVCETLHEAQARAPEYGDGCCVAALHDAAIPVVVWQHGAGEP